SSRIVASVMGQWFTIKGLVTSLTALLCLTTFSNIVSSGAFPAVLPDIARSAALADWQLGIVAGAPGLARLAADSPLALVAPRPPWTPAFLVACAPQLIAVGVAPRLLSALPAQHRATAPALYAREATSTAPANPRARPARDPSLVVLVFAAGGLVALTYSTME